MNKYIKVFLGIIVLYFIFTITLTAIDRRSLLADKSRQQGLASPTILWWKLNDGAGTSINADAGPDGTTDGTLNGSYLTLNGTSQEASTDSTITTGVSAVTVSFWASRSSWNSGPVNNVFINNGYGANGSFYINEQFGDLTFILFRGTGRFEFKSVSGLPTETFIHFAAVFDNSTANGEITVYTNGVEMTGMTVTGTTGSAGTINEGTVFVGAESASSGRLTGSLDDVRIYNSALSAGNVLAIYSNGRQ